MPPTATAGTTSRPWSSAGRRTAAGATGHADELAAVWKVVPDDRGGELKISRQPRKRELARLQNPGKPGEALLEVDEAACLEDRPVEDVLVVVDAPGDACIPVALLLVRELC